MNGIKNWLMARLDTNGDGKVNAGDVSHTLAEMRDHIMTPEQLKLAYPEELIDGVREAQSLWAFVRKDVFFWIAAMLMVASCVISYIFYANMFASSGWLGTLFGVIMGAVPITSILLWHYKVDVSFLKQPIQWVFLSLMIVVVASTSIVASSGLFGRVKDQATGLAVQQASKNKSNQARYNAAVATLDSFSAIPRSSAIVEAEIERQGKATFQQKRSWYSRKKRRRVTKTVTRTLSGYCLAVPDDSRCAKIKALRDELTRAQTYEQAMATKNEIDAAGFGADDGSFKGEHTDPLATSVVNFTGWERDKVRESIAFYFGLFIEFMTNAFIAHVLGSAHKAQQRKIALEIKKVELEMSGQQIASVVAGAQNSNTPAPPPAPIERPVMSAAVAEETPVEPQPARAPVVVKYTRQSVTDQVVDWLNATRMKGRWRPLPVCYGDYTEWCSSQGQQVLAARPVDFSETLTKIGVQQSVVQQVLGFSIPDTVVTQVA